MLEKWSHKCKRKGQCDLYVRLVLLIHLWMTIEHRDNKKFHENDDHNSSVLRKWVLDNREVKVKTKCHSLFSRSASEKKLLEIEKWKWNQNDWKSRSRGEISREFKNHSWRTFFGVVHPPRLVIFFYETWCQISLFFLKKKGEFFSLSLFSRNDSEIEMTGNWDWEVKIK